MKKRGFTLVELMVSVGIFALVMTITAGAYLTIITINRQSENLARSIDNLSFVLENMSRTMRTGYFYSCDPLSIQDCSPGNVFTFTDLSGNKNKYYLSGTTIYDDVTPSSGTVVTYPLTDSSVQITSFQVYLSGALPPPDAKQPYVRLVVTGSVVDPKNPQSFTIETAATQHGLDI